MAFPKRSPYVIIGAGIHGLSTAWHLARELRARGRLIHQVTAQHPAFGASLGPHPRIAAGLVELKDFEGGAAGQHPDDLVLGRGAAAQRDLESIRNIACLRIGGRRRQCEQAQDEESGSHV